MARQSGSGLEELMARYVAGDERAFSLLYKRTAPKLRGYLFRQCRDESLAEDVLQITYSKVHRARASYTLGAPVVPWLLVIARRALLDELRAARARGETLSDDGALPDLAVSDPFARDAERQLRRALADLPGQYMEAIALTKLEGLSGGEAAKVLGATESAVKLRVHRGYRLLRQRLGAAAAA